jgi:DNA-binding CsgD family transcriptional regulator
MKLTKKQQDVYDWAIKGLSYKHIAQRLGLAESTVKLHMTAILKAYGVKNRTQLICYSKAGMTPADVRLALPQDAEPCGWAKMKKGVITGIWFDKECPGDGWMPVYVKREGA